MLNGAPVAVNDGIFSVVHGQSIFDIDPLANDTDADDDGLSMEVVTGPSHGSFYQDTYTGLWVYEADPAYVGSDTVAYSVSDGIDSVFASILFDVTNESPSLLTPLDQTNAEGDAVSLALEATDPDGDTLQYSASGLPEGLSINSETGLISGTIEPGALTYWGQSEVTVTASDGIDSASVTFFWTVNERVTVDPVSPQSSFEGDSVSLQVTANTPDQTTLTYSALGLPSGVSIDPDTGLISGAIAPGAHTGGQPVPVTVTASDGTYSGTTTVQWTVNHRITVTPIADQQNTQGDSVSLQVVATTPDSTTLTYSASDLPDGLSINATTGLISGTVTSDALTSLVTVTATDGTYSGTSTFIWYVDTRITIGAITDQQHIEGDSVSLQVTASTPDSTTLTYSAADLPAGLSIDPNTGLISGTIAPGTATGDVPQSAMITVTDGTYSASQSVLWTIDPRLTVNPIADQQDAEGESVSLQVTATSPDSAPLVYSADVLPTGLSLDSNTGLISGTLSPDTATNGIPLAVSVTVSDGTYSANQSFLWVIDTRITIDPIPNQLNVEGDSVSFQVTASTPDSTTITYFAADLPTGVSINPSTGVISGVLGSDTGDATAYLIIITSTDSTYSATQTFLWVVQERITLEPLADQVNAEEDSVSLQVTASTPDSNPLTYSAAGLPAGLSIDSNTGLISGTLATGTATQGTPLEITIMVTDGIYSSSTTFRWTINARQVGATLIAVDDQYSLEEDQAEFASNDLYGRPSLLANDIDSSGNTLIITAINGNSAYVGTQFTLASGGTLAVDSAGNFLYQPDPGFVGVDSFTYTVSNGLMALTANVFFNVQAKEPIHLDEVMYKFWSKPWGADDKLTLTLLNQAIEDHFKQTHGGTIARDARISAALAVLKMFVFGIHEGTQKKVGPYADLFGVTLEKPYITKEALASYAKLRKEGSMAPVAILNQTRALELNDFFHQQAATGEKLIVPIRTTYNPTSDKIDKNKPEYWLWGQQDQSVALTGDYLANQIRQGIFGDCSLLSALINYVRGEKPADLQKLIREKAPGPAGKIFEVRLFDQQNKEVWIKVNEPTVAQRLLYGSAVDGSLWVTLFEMAHLDLRARQGEDTTSGITQVNGSYFEQGGTPETMEAAIRRLTGSILTQQKLVNTVTDADIIRQIKDITKVSRVVSAATPATLHPMAKARGLFREHAYAIVKYEPVGNMITLRNPHNAPGLGGKDVIVSLAEFREWFIAIATTAWREP